MILVTRILLTIVMLASLVSPGIAAETKKSGVAPDSLKHQVEDLKKKPDDHAMREKIIKMALNMKPAPKVPEEAERRVVRGTAYYQKAADLNGYKKAVSEFEAAVSAAPWFALAYYDLGVAQEKAGLYAEAIQSLKFYLMAAPAAKNGRDVKNKIYALEVYVEDIQASRTTPEPVPVPAPATAPATAAPGKSLAISGEPSLEIEPAETDLMIIKMPPPEKKTKMPNFIGSWYFKDVLRGEEILIDAFDIGKNKNGDLMVTPPKRAADSYASVTQFEINDKQLKLQLRWKMKSVAGYWKTEMYDLMLSDDSKTLAGTHNQKSIGGRNIDMDRVLFRR